MVEFEIEGFDGLKDFIQDLFNGDVKIDGSEELKAFLTKLVEGEAETPAEKEDDPVKEDSTFTTAKKLINEGVDLFEAIGKADALHKAVEEAETPGELVKALDEAMDYCLQHLSDEDVVELTEIQELAYAMHKFSTGDPIIIPVELVERYNELVAKHFSADAPDPDEILQMAKKCAKKHCATLRKNFS